MAADPVGHVSSRPDYLVVVYGAGRVDAGRLFFYPLPPIPVRHGFGSGLSRERPAHTVELDAFYIAKYEMTNGE